MNNTTEFKARSNAKQLRETLHKFSDVSKQIHSSYAYAAGYLVELAAQMLEDMDLEAQAHWNQRMQKALIEHQDRLLELLQENRTFERV